MKVCYNLCIYYKKKEFLNSYKKVYKVGITSLFKNRMGGYPKGSKVFVVLPVNGDSELKILIKFRTSFISRTDIGSEYFLRNIKEMIKILIENC